jgi:myo-inositol 2-dehydrogenase / D-chiro-inositol 1-dehydrogenase
MPKEPSIPTRRALLASCAAASLAAQTGPSGTVKLGCIGVGSRGTFLLQNLLKTEHMEVRGLCDIDPGRLRAGQKLVAATGRDEPRGHHDWRELISREDIHAVVCALPCNLHARAYLDVIGAGKDLYGEKPMCITAAECDAVVAATEKSGRVVQIGHQRRANPRYIEVIRALHAGELGRVIEGRVMWSNSWGPLYGWFGHAAESGDWIVEQAVHGWDVMNWANRCRPRRAVGLGRNDLFRDRQPERDVHDYYTAAVEYENGAVVSIIHSWAPPTKFNEEQIRIVGVEGGADFNSGTLSFRPDRRKPDRVLHPAERPINDTLLALEAFLDSVRTRKPPLVTAAQGREAVLTCLLVRQAVRGGQAATLKDILV